MVRINILIILGIIFLATVQEIKLYAQTAERIPGSYVEKNDPLYKKIHDRVAQDLHESAKRVDQESTENKLRTREMATWPEEKQNQFREVFENSIRDYSAATISDGGMFMMVFPVLGALDKKRIAEEYDIRIRYRRDSLYLAEFWEDGIAVNSEAHAIADSKPELREAVKETYARVRKSISDGKQERYTEIMALLYTVESGGAVMFHDPFQSMIDFIKKNNK